MKSLTGSLILKPLVLCGVVAAIAVSHASAELPHRIEWAQQPAVVSPSDIVTDGMGGIFLVGSSRELVKINSNGITSWIAPADLNVVFSNGVSSDGVASIYTSGEFDASESDCCDSDAYVSKYDEAGNLTWTRTIGTVHFDAALNVSADAIGNVFVAGETWGSLAAVNPIHFQDAFLAKYDSDGDLAWVRQFGADFLEDYATAVSADGIGNAYVAGHLEFMDAFVSKFDSDGTTLWTARLNNGLAWDVFADSSGSVLVAGTADGTLDSPDGLNSGNGAFVAKYDDAGNLQWVRQLGLDFGYGQTRAVYADQLGNVYAAGFVKGTTGFPETDAFIAIYDPLGELIGFQKFSSSHQDSLRSIVVDQQLNIYAGGSTNGSLFGPLVNERDGVLFRLTPIPEPSSVLLALVGATAIVFQKRRQR